MKIENIKFKAKSIYNGEWVYGDLLHRSDGAHIFMGKGEGGHILCPRVDPATVCPFTGAKDCDGTYIYEHDLLRHEKTDSTYEVVWNQGNTSFSLVNTEYAVLYPTNTFGRMLHNRRLKVIGNKLDKEK